MGTQIKYEEFKNIYLIDRVAEEDKFDHKDFAEVLGHIIHDNTYKIDNTPFNIGIFGKWGVGKSTVINLFKSILGEWNKDKKLRNYKFIEFKVWKFSANALKKKFIFTIGRELCGALELDKLNTEVRGRKTTTFPLLAQPEYFINELKKFKKNINWGLVKFCALISSLVLLLLVILEELLHFSWFHSISDLLSVCALYVFTQIPPFLSYIYKSIKEANINIAFDAYDSDEQFEEKFIELIQRDSTIKVIFIDDLDRCSEDKVIETLETIKTYLDVKTCVFVIACDDDVIKTIVKHKRSEMFKGGDGDSSDYLNKFFQYSIRIPPFVHKNMQEYAGSILESQKNDLLKLPDIYDILSILIHDEVKNPRKAISLINNFATDFEVVMNRGYKYVNNDPSKVIEADGRHQAIITIEEFNMVQEKLKRNRRGSLHRNTAHEYPLSGILICADCGHKYRGGLNTTNRKDGSKKRWYKCNAKYEHHIDCSNSSVIADVIESQMFVVLEKLMTHPDIKEGRVNGFVVDDNAVSHETIKAKKDEIEHQIAKNLEEQKLLYKTYSSKLIAEEFYTNEAIELRKNEQNLKIQLNKVQIELLQKEHSEAYQRTLKRLLEHFDEASENIDAITKKELLQCVFKELLIKDKKIVRIAFYQPFLRYWNELKCDITQIMTMGSESSSLLKPTAVR